MSQLIIIDVQQNFLVSENLDKKLLDYSKNFSDIIYIYDIINSDGVPPYDMWDKMALAFENKEFKPKVLSKEYGFFRPFIDYGLPENFIIDLGKLMIKSGYNDSREFIGGNILFFKDLIEKYQLSADTFPYEDPMIIPGIYIDLKNFVQTGAVLTGGGLNECLKEISILLNILDIDHTVNNELVY